MGRQENNCQNSQNINRLYENACIAENETVKANQTEILCWSSFIVGLGKSVDEIAIKEKVGMKKHKEQIYDFIIAHNLGTKRETLYQRIALFFSNLQKMLCTVIQIQAYDLTTRYATVSCNCV